MSPTIEMNREESCIGVYSFFLLEFVYSQFDDCWILNEQNMLVGGLNYVMYYLQTRYIQQQNTMCFQEQATLKALVYIIEKLSAS